MLQCLLLVLALLLVPAGAQAQASFENVARVVAVGDVHGDYAQFVTVLRQAEVIGDDTRWKAGTAHLVQTGDVLDRGPDSRKVLDLLMALEKQAEKAGGRVHALLGNHEVMNMAGDLRYVSPEEYAAFRTEKSAFLQDRAFELLADPDRKKDPTYRRKWYMDRPLGWVEHQQAFGPDGQYGKWLRKRNVMVRINDVVFMHGGVSPKLLEFTLDQVNERIRSELADLNKLKGGLAANEDGPLWYRGLALQPEPELQAHVDRALAHFRAQRFVVGHSMRAPVIVSRFNGRVILIDVGLSAAYGGPAASLVIEGGRLVVLHRGTPLDFPADGNLRAYIEKAASVDPSPARVLGVLQQLAQTPAGGPGH